MAKECKVNIRKRPIQRILAPRSRARSFAHVQLGLNKKESIKEAQRCLGLIECESCEICSLFCPDLCITRDEKAGEVQIDLDYCKGCGICASVCPKGAIKMVLDEGV
jgi:2-oxoacid:acceptor oxidoreductase delta subunit (pyruvate/2-ketoisovalerate family)